MPGLPWFRGQRPLDRRRGGAASLAFMRVRPRRPSRARTYWVKTMQGITKHAHAIRRINEGMFDPQMVEDFGGPLDFDEHLLDDSFYSREAC
ncbi:hypothetical protein P4114_31745 [Pseudomonas aeruginosa]|nr:hypothetical protein [Pseudomonas aeruginosa]